MKKAVFVVIMCLIVALGAAVAYFFIAKTPMYGNIKPVENLSRLSVVLPKKLPNNSTVVSGPEYDGRKKTITTSFDIDGNEFVISQQRRPETSLDQIDAEDTFLAQAGSVYVLKGEPGRLQAIVETSDSWLMVNADSKIGVQHFKELINSLDSV